MRISLKQKYHDNIYFILLIILSVSIPVSNFLMSISIIFLGANWIWEGNYKEKLKRLYTQKAALFLILFYLIHIVTLIYSTDISWAIKDLNVKLPILVLPIILASKKPLSSKKFNLVLLLYSAAVLASSFVIFAIYLKGDFHDIREISPFISHIRYSMNIVMAIFIIFWLCYNYKSAFSIFITLLVALWLLYVIVMLQSITAIVLLVLSVILVSIINLKKNYKSIRNIIIFILSIIILGSVLTYLNNERKQFYDIEAINFSNLDNSTVNGNYYYHDTNSFAIENGNYVWIYICDKELEEIWNKNAQIKYKDTTTRGFPMSNAVIRYMSSKGLRKDSLGFTQMSSQDVRNIEYGYTNYKFAIQNGLENRIYVLFWEIYEYKNTSKSRGYSLSQRLELWQTSLKIIKENWLIGVGIGDIKEVFKEELEANNSTLSDSGLRAHNQYFATLISTGIIGLILLLVNLIYPIFKRNKISIFSPFILIIIVSMLSEDLLETQAGVTFFAFFICFFLFAYQKKQQKLSDNVNTGYEEA